MVKQEKEWTKQFNILDKTNSHTNPDYNSEPMYTTKLPEEHNLFNLVLDELAI